MATPTFCCGMECGITASHWTLTNAAFSTTTVRSGVRALRCNPSSTAANGALSVASVGGTLVVGRTYIRFTTTPSADTLVTGVSITSGGWAGVCFKQSDSKLYPGTSSGVGVIAFGADGVAVTTGVWYRLDWRVNVVGNPWLVDLQVDGTATTQGSFAVAASTLTTLACGKNESTVNVTADMFFDDVLVSTTTGDYPLGAGFVLPYSPSRDGAHNVGAEFIRNTAGTVPTNTASDLWDLVDDMATDGANFIGQAAVSATEYAEIGFPASDQLTAPRAVEVLASRHEAGTGNCSRTIKLNDNGTEDTIFTSAGAGSTSLVYHTKQYATMVGGGAWTLARFNNIRLRYGYSADATPDVYLDGALIEAEYSGTQYVVPYEIHPVFCCGFECGVIAAGHWQISNGTPTVDTSIKRSGARSVNMSGTTPILTSSVISAAVSFHVLRLYIYFTTLPSADLVLCGPGAISGTKAGAVFKQSDSKIYAGHATTMGASGVAVTTGVWYRIDIRSNMSANPWLVDVQVDGVACGQASIAVAASSGFNVFIGGSEAATVNMNVDDLVVSQTLADYPIGPGHVNAYVCTSDGTHTSTGTNIVKGTVATPVGTGITVATTDANDWMDATGPIGGGAADSTRLINQQSVAAAEYVELALANTTEVVPPRAVEVLAIDRQAATTAGGSTLKIRDVNGTQNMDIFFRDNYTGVAADTYSTKQFAKRPGQIGPWTVADFNALVFRFGYSGDATPDQYLRGLMVEAEFPDQLPIKGLVVQQSVKRASYW